MNRTKLNKIIKQAGIEGVEITGAGKSLQVEIPTNDACDAFLAASGGGWGGYRTGYGSWVLSMGREPMGDYNDASSRWHY